MHFLRRTKKGTRSIAVFCGAFHPPTVAHVSLAEAALSRVDEVLWVMPESFPHKRYERVPMEARLGLLLEATDHPVAVSKGNLFFDVAGEAEQALQGPEVLLLMGEDGARRLVEWEYGWKQEETERYLLENLERHRLLSARRAALWEPPEKFSPYIEWLEHHAPEISSTVVRERINEGGNWENLVPAAIRRRVGVLYGSTGQENGQ
ncbi:MAG: nicotinate-nicotinamide nucleotide adenylyltransferase [Acidobacteriota bacterium]